MKFALCNEVLQPLAFEAQCKSAAALGYDGLEVAPFTLVEDPSAMTDAQAAVFRRMAEDQGLEILACTGCWWRRRVCRSSAPMRPCGNARPV